jgi:antitoxin component of MazEF toxin-antitoxin module
MEAFDAVPKQWGNSIGITIPKEIIDKAGISANKKIRVVIINTEMDLVKKTFGTLKIKKSIQKIMDELDEGYD